MNPLLEALKRIREMTWNDQDSYRCKDKDGCLDTIFLIAQEAIEEHEETKTKKP